MSYNSQVQGAISISPPIAYHHFRESAFLRGTPANRKKDPAVRFGVETTDVETDEGTLTRQRATDIIPAYGDPMRAYRIVEELDELLGELPPGLTLSGFLEGSGEDDTDLWRVYVVGGRAVKVRARVVWPLSDHGLGEDEVEVSTRG